jgi:phosphate/sulfate permease
VLGLFVGSIVEGPKMTTSLAGSLAPATQVSVLQATLLVSIALTFALSLLDLPVSFSMIMAAAFLGGTYAAGLPIHATHSAEVVAFWFVAPVVSAVIAFFVFQLIVHWIPRYGLLTVITFNRIGDSLTSLAVAYVLGANNLGLIYGATNGGLTGVGVGYALAIFAAVAVVAVLLFGRGGVSGTIGDRMLVLSPDGVLSAFLASSAVVWLATQFAIPLSMGQCLLGGMITKRITVLNGKLVRETIASWGLAPLVAFVVGYLLVAA